jgi:hypothetical protein
MLVTQCPPKAAYKMNAEFKLESTEQYFGQRQLYLV